MRPKRQHPPYLVAASVLLTLIVLGGVSFGIYGAVTGNWPWSSGWTAQTSGTRASLQSVAWLGNQFVAVGDNGTILTSADGSSWTAQLSRTSAPLDSVAWSGTRFVATVGANLNVGDNGTILTSTDGSSWTTQHSVTSG